MWVFPFFSEGLLASFCAQDKPAVGLIKAEEQVSLLFLNSLIYSSAFVLFMIPALHAPLFCFLFSLNSTGIRHSSIPVIRLSLFPRMSYRDILKDVPPKKNLKRK